MLPAMRQQICRFHVAPFIFEQLPHAQTECNTRQHERHRLRRHGSSSGMSAEGMDDVLVAQRKRLVKQTSCEMVRAEFCSEHEAMLSSLAGFSRAHLGKEQLRKWPKCLLLRPRRELIPHFGFHRADVLIAGFSKSFSGTD